MKILERRLHGQTVYDVYEQGPDGHSREVRTVYVPYQKTVLEDGRIYHIIYDEDLNPISDICRYLNSSDSTWTPNTVIHKVTSMRLLVAFCAIYHLHNFRIPEHLCTAFMDFLFREPRRKSTTARGYFFDVVSFFHFINYDSEPLVQFKGRTAHRIGADGIYHCVAFKNYKYAPRINYEHRKACPQHMTYAEYSKVFDVAFKAGDMAGCLILIFMFCMGRRISELLGLTVEDISSRVVMSTGEMCPCIYLRNRVGDGPRRSAKRRQVPTSAADYSSSSYTTEYDSRFGCYIIGKDVYEAMMKYYNKYHVWAMNEAPGYYATGEADIVNPDVFFTDWGLDRNHYFFLDSRGGPLTYAAWYKRLIRYCRTAGVYVGAGKSPDHSFRHGLGFLMRQEMHCSDEEIAYALGHKGTSSVDIYANADVFTISAMNDRVMKFITGKIDSLKEDL